MASSLNVAAGRIDRLLALPRRARQARLPWFPLTIMIVMLVCAVLAPLLALHDPTEISMLDAKLAPGEDLSYPLGTDIMGRDMASRLIYGARTAVFISLIALGTGAFVGTVLGLVAGFRAGWVDVLIMRASDAALGFPTILGAGIENIILAVALTVWARFARMIRGDVLAVKELDFVTFAKIAGLSMPMIIIRVAKGMRTGKIASGRVNIAVPFSEIGQLSLLVLIFYLCFVQSPTQELEYQLAGRPNKAAAELNALPHQESIFAAPFPAR